MKYAQVLTCLLLLSGLSTPADPPALTAAGQTPRAGRTRNVRLQFEFAGGSGGSPADNIVVTVEPGGQATPRPTPRQFQRRTDSNGRVAFNGVPCGGTLIIFFAGEEDLSSRTIPFPCGGGPLVLEEIFLCGTQLNLPEQPQMDLPLPGIRTRPIRFEPGRNASIIRDTLTNGGIDNYLFRARSGQDLRLHLASEDRAVRFDVYLRSDREAFLRGDPRVLCGRSQVHTQSFTGRLPQNGDYVVSVYAPGDNVSYSLDVIIQ